MLNKITTRPALLAGTLAAAILFALPRLGPAAVQSKPFIVFDNLFYKNKPDTEAGGLIRINIVYENKKWTNGQSLETLPDKGSYEAYVRAHSVEPGPIVLDFEDLPLKGAPDIVAHHAEMLATLADWAHEAAPGKPIGYYGYHTLSDIPPADFPAAHDLAHHVDVFFPSMYTFNDDRASWENSAKRRAAEAHALGPGKPIYFYLWPQYHNNGNGFLAADYWSWQLQTSHKYAEGVVLWSKSEDAWNDTTGWWEATQAFMKTVRGG